MSLRGPDDSGLLMTLKIFFIYNNGLFFSFMVCVWGY